MAGEVAYYLICEGEYENRAYGVMRGPADADFKALRAEYYALRGKTTYRQAGLVAVVEQWKDGKTRTTDECDITYMSRKTAEEYVKESGEEPDRVPVFYVYEAKISEEPELVDIVPSEENWRYGFPAWLEANYGFEVLDCKEVSVEPPRDDE